MVHVSVKSGNGRYFAEVFNDKTGYKCVGAEFEPGNTVDGMFEGERRAERDADDWRRKFAVAGIKVE